MCPFSLETEVRYPRDVLLAVAKVVREEQGQSLHLSELGALHGDVLDLGRLRELEFLFGGCVLGRLEVDVLLVLEDLECLGRAGRLRGADEYRMQLYLPGEAGRPALRCLVDRPLHLRGEAALCIVVCVLRLTGR